MDLAGGDFQCRKEIERAVPFVGALQGAHNGAVIGLHVAARPLDCLDAWLFVYAQHQCIHWRVEVQAHDVSRLASEVLIRTHAPTAHSLQVNAFTAQHTPHGMDAGAEFLGHRRPIPVRHAGRRRLLQQSQHALTKRVVVSDGFAGPRPVE